VAEDLLRGAFPRAESYDAIIKPGLLRVLETERGAINELISGIICDEAREAHEPRAPESLISALITEASNRFPEIWAGDFRDGVSRLLAESGADALSAGMGDIIGAVGLRDVAEERINAMDTRGIERIFRTFSGRYIKRIKLYGLWGGLFGIHPILTVVTAAAAFVNLNITRFRFRKRK
jgi:hypothetical protein